MALQHGNEKNTDGRFRELDTLLAEGKIVIHSVQIRGNKITKERIILREMMVHPSIREIRGRGLFIALKLNSAEQNFRLFERAKNHGFITDLFLFNKDSLRIAPPLVITDEEIAELAQRVLKALDDSLIST